MALDQQRSNRKPSGGRYKNVIKKRKSALGREPTLTRIGEKSIRTVRVRGGSVKLRIIKDTAVNLLDRKTNTYQKAVVKIVVENPANRHYVRRNIITKGTIIETDKGKARVLSRPGQDGVINAELI
jgi:small subunit ribosomal protein S8e